MRKSIIITLTSFMLMASAAVALSPYGKKAMTNLERTHLMTRVGSEYTSPAKAKAASGRYSSVNASVLFTLNNSRAKRCIYTIDPAAGTFQSHNTPEIYPSGGGVMIDGKYYCMSRLKVMRNIYTRFYVYNADTWGLERSQIDLPETLNATDVTYDPTTGRVYGCFYDGTDKWVIGTIDYTTLTRTTLASSIQLNALAADEAGNIYGIDMDGVFYSVDKLSGQLTKLADTAIKATYTGADWQGTATFDPLSGKVLYAAYSTNLPNPSDDDYEGSIWAISTDGTEVSQVKHFYDEDLLEGMYIPMAELFDEIPSAPTGLTASFPDGALEGDVSFVMPKTLVGGMNFSGNMDYVLKANGTVIAEGSAAGGTTITKHITLTAGSYCFSATASNSEGTSRAATLIAFIGTENPAMPQVKAEYDYTTSTMSLQWQPVTTTDFGTPLSPGSVKYRVVRYPEEVVVANDLSETSFTEPLQAQGPKGVIYSVEAVADGVASGAFYTPEIFIGAYTPRFYQDFMQSDALRGFTVIDADSDNLTWKVSTIDHAAVIIWNNNAEDSEMKDDWLITPGMYMEAGKIYFLNYGERRLYDPETLTVMMGRNPKAEAMTTTVTASHAVTNDIRPIIKSNTVTVDADGIYFFGFHATSPRNSGTLYISDLEITQGVAAEAPVAVTDFTVTPAADRSHKAEITFTAPSKNMVGSDLTALTGVEVMRDGVVIGTAPATVGAAGSYTDTGAHQGSNTYTVRAVSEAGKGEPAQATVFIGWDEPNRAERVRAHETETDGVVTVTWNAPELDNNNSELTSEALSYDITLKATLPNGKTESKIVAEDVQGTSHDVTVCTPEEQRFVEFSVTAKTEGGSARAVWTPDAIPAGKADATPYTESFTNGKPQHMWGMYNDYSEGTSWFCSDDYTYDITSVDADNGFIVMEGEESGASAEMYSAKINLEGLENPTLSFYTYNIYGTGDDLNQNQITVSVYDGTQTRVAKNISLSDYNEDGWQRVAVPLDDYAGTTVQILIKGTIVNFYAIAIDNITIADTFSKNLSAAALSLPGKVLVGKSFTATAKVENTGRQTMPAYTLRFFCDGSLVETRQGRSLAAGESQYLDFEGLSHNITSEEFIEYWFDISCADDECSDDDTSRHGTVQVALPQYPAVTDLKAASNSQTTPSMMWSAPDLTSTVPFEIIEDFESYPAFSNSNLADWTLYDGDRCLIGGIEDANEGEIELPGIPAGSQQSWFVFDGDYEKLNFTYRANSGRQHLATMYCYSVDSHGIGSEAQNDDWLISPLLAKDCEEFSFYARGYSYMAPDALEILVTTDAVTDPIKCSYRSLGIIDPMPTTWDQYTVELPAGTARFALRSVGNFGFMLFVDDITFTPAAGAKMLEIKGYNVYRNGEKINTELITDTKFTDTTASDGNHTYAVTTVYNRGESRLSNKVSMVSGVENITADPEAEAEYFNTLGIKVQNPSGGIFIRRQGSVTTKVLIP